MWCWTTGCAGLAAAASVLMSGCAATCGANPDKLAALQRGMSYEETTRIMGCSGSLVSPQGPASGEVSTIEWTGPGTIVVVGGMLLAPLLFLTVLPAMIGSFSWRRVPATSPA
jgi:cobalt-zinc-cadmium resistance protein CzcA